MILDADQIIARPVTPLRPAQHLRVVGGVRGEEVAELEVAPIVYAMK